MKKPANSTTKMPFPRKKPIPTTRALVVILME